MPPALPSEAILALHWGLLGPASPELDAGMFATCHSTFSQVFPPTTSQYGSNSLFFACTNYTIAVPWMLRIAKFVAIVR